MASTGSDQPFFNRALPAAPPELSLNDIIASVNDAALTARNVTTATLGTAITLAATILASSDEAILRNQLAMPFGLGTVIQLSIAYALMPIVFVFLHGNLLLQFHVLMQRLQMFDKRLRNDIADPAERDRWRRRLHGFAFVQFHTDDDDSVTDFEKLLEYARNTLLWLVNQAAISIVPMALLIATLVSFLRYQSEVISLVHRVAVLVDLAMIIWFKIVETRDGRRPVHHPMVLLFMLLAVFIPAIISDGFSVWWSIALLLGAISGCVAALSWKPEWVVWVICVLLGSAVCVLTEQDRAIVANWLLGLLGVALIRIVWVFWLKERSQSFATSPIRLGIRSGNRFAGNVLRFAAIPGLIFVFVVYHATVPSGREEACQIRWEKEKAKQYIRQQITKKAADEGATGQAEPEITEQDLNRRLTWNYIIKPALFHESQPCIENVAARSSSEPVLAPKQIPNGSETDFANILDRGICATWQVGCRYLNLSSRVLMGRDAPQAAIASFEMTPNELTKVTQRALGLQARDRNLRFAVFADATLLAADLRGADLHGAYLTDARMVSVDLSQADLTNAKLQGTTLQDATLYGAVLDFSDATNARLDGVAGREMEAVGTDFTEATLDGGDFHGTNFIGANFTRAQMNGASFASSNMSVANLSNSHLQAAILGKMKLDKAYFNFQGGYGDLGWLAPTSMDGAVLYGTSLLGAIGESSCLGTFSGRNTFGPMTSDAMGSLEKELKKVEAREPELAADIQRIRQLAKAARHAPRAASDRIHCTVGDMKDQVFGNSFSDSNYSAACVSRYAARTIVKTYTAQFAVINITTAPTSYLRPGDPLNFLGVYAAVGLARKSADAQACPVMKDLTKEQKSTLATTLEALLPWFPKFRQDSTRY